MRHGNFWHSTDEPCQEKKIALPFPFFTIFTFSGVEKDKNNREVTAVRRSYYFRKVEGGEYQFREN